MKSQINWNNILRKKKRLKRKQEQRNADVIMNKALETAKKQKQYIIMFYNVLYAYILFIISISQSSQEMWKQKKI